MKKNEKVMEKNQPEKRKWRDRMKDRAKTVKKFPPYYKGYMYKPYMKGCTIFIDVARADNRGKKTTYKIVGTELMMVSTTMPPNMHREYVNILSKNIAGIVSNLKWHQLLRFRIANIFKRKAK